MTEDEALQVANLVMEVRKITLIDWREVLEPYRDKIQMAYSVLWDSDSWEQEYEDEISNMWDFLEGEDTV